MYRNYNSNTKIVNKNKLTRKGTAWLTMASHCLVFLNNIILCRNFISSQFLIVLGKLVPFAELSVAHASVLTILAISLERYIAICRPLRANYTCTKQRAVFVCIGIWILGFIATRYGVIYFFLLFFKTMNQIWKLLCKP